MGNFCCADDLNRGLKYEELYFDVDRAVSLPRKTQNFLHPRLETVKEEQNEYSEQSDYRSVSRGSRHNA